MRRASPELASYLRIEEREVLVTSRVEAERGPLAALLEVAIAPTPLTSDKSIA